MAKQIKPSDRLKVFNKFNGRCAYCGCFLNQKNFHVDHIQAKFRKTEQSRLSVIKGKDHIDNYNPACISCNCSKSTLTLEQWRLQIQKKQKQLFRDSSTYRMLLRFNLVIEKESVVKFYFEEVCNG